MDAIGQLTGGIAHDFNNLLAAVLGGLHLLERRLSLEPRELLIIEQMRHAAEQGAELVRRMMAFARKQDLTPASVDPIPCASRSPGWSSIRSVERSASIGTAPARCRIFLSTSRSSSWRW